MYPRLYQEASKTVDAMLYGLEEGRKTTAFECEKAEYVFDRILGTMMDLGIIDEWDGDLLHDYCQEMNEKNEEE